MESIPYRRTNLLVRKIPKGTLLFRLSKDQESDTRGVLLEDGTRCITPNYNVFFHPNPFIGYHIYKEYLDKIGDTVHIYKTTKDIKVLLLLNPSPYNRLDRKKKGIFIKRCSTVKKGCMPRKGHSYDPCVSDTIIKKYPEVVGMLSNAPGDAKLLSKALKRGIPNKTLKTFKKAKDSFGYEGVPELILHPLAKRSSSNVIVKPEDTLDMNYELLKSVKYKESELHTFMDKHAVYNPETYFYTYKE